jgi:DNA-binding transcriptional regulator YhcF (GntR family)
VNAHSSRREERIHSIKLAIRRVQTGRVRTIKPGTRLSISSVAAEAGIDAATIHTTYPDLAEQIRALVGKESRVQRDQKASLLKEARARNAGLHAEVATLRSELASLASKHATLILEVDRLRAFRNGGA